MKLLSYLAYSTLENITAFFRRWYKDGAFFLSERMHAALSRVDRIFAIRVSTQYIFQPMYKDRSVIGYILGFIFRAIRIALGSLVHACIITFFVAVYVLYAATPILIMAWPIFS